MDNKQGLVDNVGDCLRNLIRPIMLRFPFQKMLGVQFCYVIQNGFYEGNIVTLFDKLNNCAGKPFLALVAISTILVVTGCQSKPTSKVTPASKSAQAVSSSVPAQGGSTNTTIKPAEAPVEMASESAVTNCQRELTALSKINGRLYVQKKAAFDDLLASASVYASVRGDIASQTKDTMDALFKYRTQKLCSDIQQTVQQALISRGENFK